MSNINIVFFHLKFKIIDPQISIFQGSIFWSLIYYDIWVFEQDFLLNFCRVGKIYQDDFKKIFPNSK